jgi:hypothetical protein
MKKLTTKRKNMRKNLTILVLVSILSVQSWGIFDYYRSMFVFIDTTKELAMWTEGDPVRLSYWIQNNIYYRDDTEKWQEWVYPEVTFDAKFGDCEEFATLPYYVMGKWGCKLPKYIISFTGKDKGHTVLFYKWNGKWSVMSNGKIGYCEEDYLYNAIDKYIKSIGYTDFKFRNIDGTKLDWKLSREALQISGGD